MKFFRPGGSAERQTVRVAGGSGTMVTQVGDQISVRAVGRGRRFAGAWKCSLLGDSVAFRQGFVNGLEPILDGRLIGGTDAEGVPYPEGQPELDLSNDLYDADGNSWLGLQLRVDAEGKMKEKDYTEEDLTVVQSERRLVLTGPVAFFPLAKLRRVPDEDGWGVLRQIAWFDYQHGVSGGGEGEPMRHWFFPA